MNEAIFQQAAAVRERKGVSLRAIADSTKICLRYLQAIEEQRFDLLPGGVYNTSYIRQYARAFDFSEECLVNAYYQSSPEWKETGKDERVHNGAEGENREKVRGHIETVAI